MKILNTMIKEDVIKAPKFSVEIFLQLDYKVLKNCMAIGQRLRLSSPADDFIKQAIDNHIKLHKHKL